MSPVTRYCYKDFILRLRKVETEDSEINLTKDICPELKIHMNNVFTLHFEEATMHSYFNKIKDYVSAFLRFWSDEIDAAEKEADKHLSKIDKVTLLHIIQTTIDTEFKKQIDFGKDYLPVVSAIEKKSYEDVELKYKIRMEELKKIRLHAEELYKANHLVDFSRSLVRPALRKVYEVFEFAHTYLAMSLAEHLHELRVSLEEMSAHVRANLSEARVGGRLRTRCHLDRLYEKKRECSKTTRGSADYVEVQRKIEDLEKTIKSFRIDPIINDLEQELKYWEDKLKSLNDITRAINFAKEEREKILKEKKLYDQENDAGQSRWVACWKLIGENIEDRLQRVDLTCVEAVKALTTLFNVRGWDVAPRGRAAGGRAVDEFGHEVFSLRRGAVVCHVTCDGTLTQIKKEQLYSCDAHGRHRADSRPRLYQRANCASCYHLTDSGLFEKVTKDCGHSDKPNSLCLMEIKDPNIRVLLPDTEKIYYKNTQEPEVVEYIWRAFGGLLAGALAEVAARQPRNPIQYLAHTLLRHKYSSTAEQLQERDRRAQQYRDDVLGKRQLALVEASRAWRRRQVRPQPPADEDAAAAAPHSPTHLYFTDYY